MGDRYRLGTDSTFILQVKVSWLTWASPPGNPALTSRSCRPSAPCGTACAAQAWQAPPQPRVGAWASCSDSIGTPALGHFKGGAINADRRVDLARTRRRRSVKSAFRCQRHCDREVRHQLSDASRATDRSPGGARQPSLLRPPCVSRSMLLTTCRRQRAGPDVGNVTPFKDLKAGIKRGGMACSRR